MAKEVIIADNPAFNGVSAGKVTGLAPDQEKIFGTGSHDQFFINTDQGLKKFSLEQLAYQEKPGVSFGSSINAASEGAKILQQRLAEQGVSGLNFTPTSSEGIQGITQFRPDAVRAGFGDYFKGRHSGFSGGTATLDEVIAAFSSGRQPAQDFTGSETVTNTLERVTEPTVTPSRVGEPNADQTVLSAASTGQQFPQFVNAQGQTVTPRSPEEMANFQALGFQQVGAQPQTTVQAAGLGQVPGQAPSGAELPSGPQYATGQPEPTPANAQLAETVTQQAASNPTGKPNAAYVNAVFKAYHNRDATQDELNRYTSGQFGIDQAYREIKGGAPQPVSAEQLALEQQGYQRILNPQSMEELAATAGFDPSKIQRVGNKLFAPTELTTKVSDVVGKSGLADTSVKGLDTLGGSDLKSDDISAAADNYANQYLSQLGGDFDDQRKAFWTSLLMQTDFREKTRTELEDEAGLEDLSNQLTELDKQIAVRQQAWNTLMEDVENSPISITAIQGRNAHVKRMASIEMEGLLGQRAALVGDYDRAVDHIERAYTAAVGDYEENVQNLKDWYTENKEFFTRDEQRAYDAKIKAEERAYDLKKLELAQIANLMGEYPTAGITLNDSWDDIAQKVAKVKPSISTSSYGNLFNQIDSNNLTTGIPEVKTNVSTLLGDGIITAYGSDKWAQGLDLVLSGGDQFNIGAPVPSFGNGEVVFVGENGGFGNQVKIDYGNGLEAWYSHLDQTDVQVGDIVSAGTVIGTQGNTGDVIAAPGMKGSHLDLTMIQRSKDPDGVTYDFLSPQEVYKVISGQTGLTTQSTPVNGGIPQLFTPQNLGFAIDTTLSNITSENQREFTKDVINSYLSSGNMNGIMDLLSNKAYQRMSATQQDEFNDTDGALSANNRALNVISEAEGLQVNPYASLYQAKAPWALMKRDPQYTDLFQAIELGQAKIRRGFFGTAVTDAEAGTAKRFLIDDDDDFATIQRKLIGNSAFFQFANDAQLSRQLGLKKPNINDYYDYYADQYNIQLSDLEAAKTFNQILGGDSSLQYEPPSIFNFFN